MRAVRIDRYGGPEVVAIHDLPVPVPGPGEVLVKVNRSGINFMDVHARQGKYARSRTYPVRLPLTLGIEGAGRAVALGEGVSAFAIGDRVAFCLSWGSHADYAAVPLDRLVAIPDALSDDIAAAALFHGLTAHYLAHDVGRLRSGVTCLIHAGSGGIGQLLVQMAARAGARVIATASTDDKRDAVRRCGAHHVIGYKGFAEAVLDATYGLGAAVVFDPIGRDTLRESFRATARHGLVVAFGAISGAVDDLDPIELGEAGSLFLTRPRLADHVAGTALAQRGAEVYAALASGALSVSIGAHYRMADIGVAHGALAERTNLGKPLLCIDES